MKFRPVLMRVKPAINLNSFTKGYERIRGCSFIQSSSGCILVIIKCLSLIVKLTSFFAVRKNRL